MNTETEALLAVLRGDDEATERLVRSLTREQRALLRRGLYRLDQLNERIRCEVDR
jgi:hypothetical protein